MRSVKEIMRDSAVLDANGIHIGGSDRESNHSYGDAYEHLFPDRAAVKLMMEVGVADGSSLLAWREVFPNATCVGVDIHYASRVPGNGLGNCPDRIEFYLGDQRSRVDCERAASGRLFDVIVEDATHHLADTLLTLFWLWPSVAPGGLYIVEEWEGVAGDRDRLRALWPGVEIVGTRGPHIQDEPLVVFRKPAVSGRGD